MSDDILENIFTENQINQLKKFQHASTINTKYMVFIPEKFHQNHITFNNVEHFVKEMYRDSPLIISDYLLPLSFIYADRFKSSYEHLGLNHLIFKDIMRVLYFFYSNHSNFKKCEIVTMDIRPDNNGVENLTLLLDDHYILKFYCDPKQSGYNTIRPYSTNPNQFWSGQDSEYRNRKMAAAKKSVYLAIKHFDQAIGKLDFQKISKFEGLLLNIKSASDTFSDHFIVLPERFNSCDPVLLRQGLEKLFREHKIYSIKPFLYNGNLMDF